MPRRKSPASLKELCFEIAIQNLNSLQHSAKSLPLDLINDLYNKSYEQYRSLVARKKELPPPLPSDLFFHSRTKKIKSLGYFDCPADEVAAKINRRCKNLEIVFLHEQYLDHIDMVTRYNPHISVISIHQPNCTDHHVLIISKHCPELRVLCMCHCNLITDEVVDVLPEKLIKLSLPYQVSFEAHFKALERLPYLKILKPFDCWNKLITMYGNRFDNRKFQIEEIEISIDDPTYPISPETVRTLFPNLRNVIINWEVLGVDVATFLKGINCKLLTSLHVNVTANIIRIAAHLCPMLEELDITIHSRHETISDRYLDDPKIIPFKYLRVLSICDRDSKVLMDDFKLLLTNCWQLESLTIKFNNELSDQLIYILELNSLKSLRSVQFDTCGPFTVESLYELVKSLESLERLSICQWLSPKDKDFMEKQIEQMNWDLELEWTN